jgi:hypothetical protein
MNSFVTHDLVIASTLVYEGYVLENIDIVDNRGSFRFSDVSDKVVDNIRLGYIEVEPLTFHKIVRQLTSQVRRAINNDGINHK